MCLSTPKLPVDNSAQIAQQQNDARQAAITAGQSNIDSAFGKFDQPYFDQYTKAYEDNYNPQVDEQYQRAQQKEGYAAARTGTLNSTPAIHAADLLNESYGQQRQQVAGNAIDATNNLQNQIQQQKSQLYALNTSAADPTLAAQNANAAAGTLSSQPQYSVLGDLFSGLVNTGAGIVAGQNQVNPYLNKGFAPGTGLPSGSGSGKVIG